MSTENKKLRKFQAVAKIEVQSTITIQAADLDEAFAKAKEMKLQNFVDIFGDIWDTEYQLTGVYE